VLVALDAASTEFYNPEEKMYNFKKIYRDKLTIPQMVDFWADWCKKYPIISIEEWI